MTISKKSIFSLKRDKEELYLTQVFAYLLSFDKDFCAAFLNKISGNEFNSTIEKIEAEVVMDTCQPDIVISLGDDKKIVIENKIDASFTTDQIQRYKNNSEVCAVYLLYRTLTDIDQANLADDAISWSEVFLFINQYIKTLDNSDSVKKYLFDNFCLYLKEKGLAMEKVSWEIINGTRALQNLMEQIKIALQSFKKDKSIFNFKTVTNSTSSYTGWEVSLNKDESFAVYIQYSPTIIFSYFNDNYDWSKKYKNISKEIPELNWGNNNWLLNILKIIDGCFLCSSVDDQFSMIKKFIADSIDQFNKK
jgi:uncharacterized protein YlzI (FlbEa/FlbD family)